MSATCEASAGGARTALGSPAPSARRGRDPSGERGSVTAELALALPAVVMVLLVCLTLAGAVLGQVRCADAARAAARAAAIGEPAAVVVSVARELAGEDAEVAVDDDGEWVEIVVSRPLAPGVPGADGLRAQATARAWVEPGAGP